MRLNWSAPPIYDSANVGITGGNTEFNALQSGIAFVKAPTGSMANNGAITLGTPLAVTYAEGCYMWLPAGAVAAGVPAAATWLWVVMSSTTLGTVFNSTYTSGTPATGVATAFTTTGPGAFAGDTGTVTGLSFTVPALPINGRFEFMIGWSVNNTAGSKNISPRLGSSNVISPTVTTQTSICSTGFAQNCGRTDKQRVGGMRLNSVGAAESNGLISVDTSVATTATVLMNAAVATDFVTLESYRFRVLAP